MIHSLWTTPPLVPSHTGVGGRQQGGGTLTRTHTTKHGSVYACVQTCARILWRISPPRHAPKSHVSDKAIRVAQADSSVAAIEEVLDEWAAGTFRVLYTGAKYPWQLGRIERRPSKLGANDTVSVMWYDRNEGSTTRFSRAPLKKNHGLDKVLVKSFGPAVTQYTNSRGQDHIEITRTELARITEAVKDWDQYEDSSEPD